MRPALAVLGLLALATLGASAGAEPLEERARQLLRSVPLVDGHNDLPWRLRQKVQGQLSRIDVSKDTAAPETLQTDLLRLRRGGVGAQFWSVYVPAEQTPAEAVVEVLEQIDVVHRLVQRYPDDLELAGSAAEVRRSHKRGRIACLIGVEGGHCVANSLGVLRQLHRLGARYMTLTHNKDTAWADACSDKPALDGLSPFGIEIVREMNRLGMLVDLSHVSAATMHDALDASAAPVLFSHSSTRALTEHLRNVPDDVLRRLPANGGVVMVTFVPRFVSPEVMAWDAEEEAEKARLGIRFPGQTALVEEHLKRWRAEHPAPRATLQQVADHIEHVVRVAGIEHVGLGSDFDGMRGATLGLEDVSKFPALLAELLRRGWSDRDVQRLAGLNLLRVLERAEAVAQELRAKTPAETLFEPPATSASR